MNEAQPKTTRPNIICHVLFKKFAKQHQSLPTYIFINLLIIALAINSYDTFQRGEIVTFAFLQLQIQAAFPDSGVFRSPGWGLVSPKVATVPTINGFCYKYFRKSLTAYTRTSYMRYLKIKPGKYRFP